MNTGNIADFLLGVVTPGVVPGADASQAQPELDAAAPDFASLLDSRVIAAALRDAVLPAEPVVETEVSIAPTTDFERPESRPQIAAPDAPAVPPVAPVPVEPTVAQVPANESAVSVVADDSAPASPMPAPPRAAAASPLSAVRQELPLQSVPGLQLDEPDAPLPSRFAPSAAPARQVQTTDDTTPVIHDGEIATRVRTGVRIPVNATEGTPAVQAPAVKPQQQSELPRVPQDQATVMQRAATPAPKIPVAQLRPAESDAGVKPDMPVTVPENINVAAEPLVRSSRIRRPEFRQAGSGEGVAVSALRKAAPQAENIQVTTAAPAAQEDVPRESARRAAAEASPNVVLKGTGSVAVETPAVATEAVRAEPALKAEARVVIGNDAPVESISNSPTRPDMAAMPHATATHVRPEVAERVALGRESIAPTVNREIADLVRTQGQDNGAHKAKIRIHPPELGTVSVELRVHHQRVAVELLVENRDVKMLLSANESGIRASLADQGLSLESFNVGMSHQSHGEQQATQRHAYESTSTATTAEAEAFASASEPLEFLTDKAVNVFA